jgi:TM2 domain-containing membrane protein YozV
MRGGPEERSRHSGPRRDDSTGRVLAFLTPLGQFYNGEIWKGIVVVVLYFVEFVMVFSFFGTLVGLIAIVATWIWAFTDARKVQRGLKEPW